MSTQRRYVLALLVGVLLPLFVPQLRDIISDWRKQTGVDTYIEESTPGTIALIKQMQAKGHSVRILVDGKPVDVPAPQKGSEPTQSDTAQPPSPQEDPQAAPLPAEDDLSLDLKGNCTYTGDEMEALLTEYHSPAAGQGLGQFSVDLCKETGIDNSYWIWQFVHESGAGSNRKWAGYKPDGTTTANTGNIICAGYESCYGRFRDYNGDWRLGTTQHFLLLKCYRDGGGDGCGGLWNGKAHRTIVEAIDTWAPSFENDTESYSAFVADQTRAARRIKEGQFVAVGGEPASEPVVTESNPVELPPGDKARSTPLPLDGFGVYSASTIETNIVKSVEASPGLQHAIIKPGETWSFNQNWTVDVADLSDHDYGVQGEGVCDLAARYADVAINGLGLQTVYFPDHRNAARPVRLALVPDNANTVIWGTPGVAGGSDLTITNPTEKTVHLAGVVEGDAFYVLGWYE